MSRKFLSFFSANPVNQPENKNLKRPWSEILEEGSWVRTNLDIRDIQIRPSLSSNGGEFLLTLQVEEMDESDWNYGKPQKSVSHSTSLTFEVQGKEIALFTGLVGRRIRVLGWYPGLFQSLETLLQENYELKEAIQEFKFQFEQLGISSRMTKFLDP
jgi:hypothetical protein